MPDQAHLRGRKHKRRVEVSGARPARPSAHYCAICDITTTSAQHMAMHVAGKARALDPKYSGNYPGILDNGIDRERLLQSCFPQRSVHPSTAPNGHNGDDLLARVGLLVHRVGCPETHLCWRLLT